MANSHKLKIQDGGGCHLEFRKNVNNSGLDTYICTKLYGNMQHGHAEIHDQKSKPKVNSRDCHQINVWSISVLISVTVTDI